MPDCINQICFGFKTLSWERYDYMADLIEDYDIVALQEAWGENNWMAKYDFIEEVSEEGFYHATPSLELPSGKTADSGLLIFSKYEIMEQDFISFTDLTDSTSNKGCQYAKINIKDDIDVHVFNLHT